MSKTLILNGTIIHTNKQEKADILIEDGQIRAIGNGISHNRGSKIVECRGRLIFPAIFPKWCSIEEN